MKHPDQAFPNSAAIRNFDEERAIYNIQNNYDQSTNHQNYQPTFNPLDEYRNEVQENRRLVGENPDDQNYCQNLLVHGL